MDKVKKLLLRSKLSPGDATVFTAAIYSLHTQYPGEYMTDVETCSSEIWENNPHISTLSIADPEVDVHDVHYSLVHKSNEILTPFINGYVQGLSEVIERPLQLQTNRPHLYLSEDEVNVIDQVHQHFTGKKIPFFLINAGTKKDFTCKQWPIEYYQQVVRKTYGEIQWVQVGSKEHSHHPIRGALDFRGKTDTRQFIRLVANSCGGLGPSTFLQHVCAAFEKPYLCLLGGREGVGWTVYPRQHTFHTIGALDCCAHGGCWKSRVVALKDDDEQNKSLCKYPMLGYMRPSPKCMALIKPEEVISVLRRIL